MSKTIRDLMRDKGYRSARELADALGISPSSLSRYENQRESIPIKAAWSMADALGCTIDEVVGREFSAPGKGEIQSFYDGLMPECRSLMDDLIEFVRGKDEDARRRQRDADERQYMPYMYHYISLFYNSLDDEQYDSVVAFGTHEQEREAFERFLGGRAAAKRQASIQTHLEALEEELREGFDAPEYDADGNITGFSTVHFDEGDLQMQLAEERGNMEAEQSEKDREVIRKIMAAYDALYANSARAATYSYPSP